MTWRYALGRSEVLSSVRNTAIHKGYSRVMRVLVVDHDSTVLEATVRALREHFVIDAVTNKADCLDLLRQNTFDIVVACERLEDGSGLELLGQIARRWPATLRVFAADRERLRLLNGRLGPFELFQALSYPINAEKLLSTLSLARDAHDAHADTTTIQHIVLSAEESAEPEPPPPPPRSVSATTLPTRTRPQGIGSRQNISGRAPAARRLENQQPRVETAVHARPGSERPRAPAALSSKRRPTRIPPYPSSSPDDPVMNTSLAEAAGIAAAARSRFGADTPTSWSRKAFIAGAGCTAAVAAVALIALKLSSSSNPGAAPAAAAAAVQTQFPKAVTDQVAAVEADFEQDDYKKAQADIRTLQQLAPGYPRLRFFSSLLERSQRAGLATRERSEPAARRKSAAPAVAVKSELPATAATAARKVAEVSAGAGASARKVAELPAAAAASPGKVAELPASAAAAPREVAAVTTAPSRSKAVTPPPPSFSGSEEHQVLVAGAPTSSVPLLVPASAVPDPSETLPAPRTAAITPSASSDARQPVSDTPPPQTAARLPSAPASVTVDAQLTHRVEAQYPEAALRNGVQGYVDVQFTITAQGTVTNVAVVRSAPDDIFDRAAVDAVSRWRYDPRVVDGRPVESQSHARVRFKLDSSLSH